MKKQHHTHLNRQKDSTELLENWWENRIFRQTYHHLSEQKQWITLHIWLTFCYQMYSMAASHGGCLQKDHWRNILDLLQPFSCLVHAYITRQRRWTKGKLAHRSTVGARYLPNCLEMEHQPKPTKSMIFFRAWRHGLYSSSPAVPHVTSHTSIPSFILAISTLKQSITVLLWKQKPWFYLRLPENQ